MNWIIGSYFLFIFAYRLGEFYAIIRTHNLYKPDHTGDWSIYLVWVPMFIVIMSSFFQYHASDIEPRLPFIIIGTIFLGAAVVVRAVSLSHCTQAFAQSFNKSEQYQFLTYGIYRHLRHPLYLANILLMIGCSAFLASSLGMIFTLVGIGAIFFKMEQEEKLMEFKYSDYHQYKNSTYRLIPMLY